jgi:hypothetical protein
LREGVLQGGNGVFGGGRKEAMEGLHEDSQQYSRCSECVFIGHMPFSSRKYAKTRISAA